MQALRSLLYCPVTTPNWDSSSGLPVDRHKCATRLSAQVAINSCRWVEQSPQAPAKAQELTVTIEPIHKRSSCASRCAFPLVQPLQRSAVRCWQLSCPPVCLLLCPSRWISTGPGGHCFHFAKSISHTILGWDSEEKVGGQSHSLSPKLEVSSCLEHLRWNQVPEEAQHFSISSNIAVIAEIDDT